MDTARTVLLKSMLRRPVPTLLLVLLVGSISYAFIARAVQYVIIQRETERLSGYYRAIGSLVPDAPNRLDVSQGAEIVEKSGYAALGDKRRHSPAALEGLLNADVDGYTSTGPVLDQNGYGADSLQRFAPHVSDLFFYGELLQKNDVHVVNGSDRTLMYYLFFKVDAVAAGYPDYAEPGQDVRVTLRITDDAAAAAAASLESGKRYLIRAYYKPTPVYLPVNGLDWHNAWHYLVAAPLTRSGPWFVPVEPGKQIGLDDPALTGLRDEMELLQENQRAVEVCTSADMSSMPETQQSSKCYYLTGGRWPNAADNIAKNPVCAVPQGFAQLRGLCVGDTVRLRLRCMPVSYYGYIISGDGNVPSQRLQRNAGADWRELPTCGLTLTIVGIYGQYDADSVPLTSGNLLLYIPDSVMPAEYGGSPGTALDCGSYSFVLGSARDQDAFVEKTRDSLAGFGLSVRFVENNAANFWASAAPLELAAAADAAIWGTAMLLALVLGAFLYLMTHRKEYAILRALGMPRSAACVRLLLPIALLGGIAIPAGGAASWGGALSNAATTLSEVMTPEGVAADPSLSPVWLVVFCAAAFAALLLFVVGGILLLARRSVLALMHGAGKRTGAKRPAWTGARSPGPVDAANIQAAAEPERSRAAHIGQERRGSGSAAYIRFALRHTLRAPLKPLLNLTVAALFLFSLGWMRVTMARDSAEIDRLYDTTVVEAEIVKRFPSITNAGTGKGFIARSTVDAVLNSGCVQSAYIVAASRWTELSAPKMGAGSPRAAWDVDLCAFDDAGRFFRSEGRNAPVKYAPGFDESMFSAQWSAAMLSGDAVPPVVLPEAALSLLGLEPGGTVYLTDIHKDKMDVTRMFSQRCRIAGVYSGQIQSQGVTEAVLLPRTLLEALEAKDGKATYYATARFALDPAMNRAYAQSEADLTALAERPGAGLTDLRFVFWDEELRHVVEPMERNLRLLEALYPVALALFALIAMVLSALSLWHGAREASLLRLFGARRRAVCAMLLSGMAFVTVVGLSLGLMCIVPLQRSLHAALWGTSLLYAGIYLAGALLGGALAAVLATGKPPLMLMQAKEKAGN